MGGKLAQPGPQILWGRAGDFLWKIFSCLFRPKGNLKHIGQKRKKSPPHQKKEKCVLGINKKNWKKT